MIAFNTTGVTMLDDRRDLAVLWDIRVAACFCQRQGCVLGGIRRFAYPQFPQEIQLLWYKDL